MNLLDIFEIAYCAFTRNNLPSVHTKLTSESSHRNRIVLKPMWFLRRLRMGVTLYRSWAPGIIGKMKR